MKDRKRRKYKGIDPKKVQRAREAFNKLYSRTRPQGEKIPVDRPEIEPDEGERL